MRSPRLECFAKDVVALKWPIGDFSAAMLLMQLSVGQRKDENRVVDGVEELEVLLRFGEDAVKVVPITIQDEIAALRANELQCFSHG